ncbi:sugar transferase [Alphaproteobacteria bacterium KMM 3653]|uniref:Sugar transferase n=1 Tax=Harenicola maris TaxID=2841044 RepID=A0AAP2CNN6_9RHOB|nr:sugar transferase [Harenicola maris]
MAQTPPALYANITTVSISPRLSLPSYRITKRAFDLCLGALLILPLTLTALALLLLNPLLNPGPLFFVQTRMGQGGLPFSAWKFRTMAPATKQRGALDGLEQNRLSVFTRALRKTRLDELPQIINVLRGEMTLIGPRPDSFEQAQAYCRAVGGYSQRLSVLPGISGFAQTEVGYVENLGGVRRKVAADLYYIRNASLSLDLWITWRTIMVVLQRKGA